ncbi:MAG TPA: hypothetical protein VMH01_12970 [Puia sp.]|nr:hypothetical protein [Puia sp.]
MKLSTFAVILAIIALGYGLALVFIPVSFSENYGIILDKYGVLPARAYGLALCQLGIIFWMSRNIPPSDKVWRILLVTTILFNLVNIPLAIVNISNGLSNSMGWTTVAVHALIVLGASYFAFSKSTSK